MSEWAMNNQLAAVFEEIIENRVQAYHITVITQDGHAETLYGALNLATWPLLVKGLAGGIQRIIKESCG